MGGQRTLVAIVAGVVALLVLAVGVVLLKGEPPVASFAPDSPPATLQSYLAAWDAGDSAAAWTFFSTRVQGRTTAADYRSTADTMRAKGMGQGQSRRVFFDEVRMDGDSAQMRVTIETSYVGGISVDRYRTSLTIAMVRERGGWKIDQELMGLEPWGFPQ